LKAAFTRDGQTMQVRQVIKQGFMDGFSVDFEIASICKWHNFRDKNCISS
jgi:hypothetical protein